MNSIKSINWRTSLTVSSIIEHDNKFLLIEEHTRDGIFFNQPSGHLEANETPISASIRETMEETAYNFIPEYFLGAYLCQAQSKKDNMFVTYLRLAFCGKVGELQADKILDEGIIATHWLSYEQILQYDKQKRLRSSLVLKCIDDYLAKQRYPLNMIYSDASVVLP
jgi:phosphatase NudJ